MNGIFAFSEETPALPSAVPGVRRGQEGRAVSIHSAVRQRGTDGDEAGQVQVLGSKAIGDPGAHAGTDERVAAGVQLQQRPAVT